MSRNGSSGKRSGKLYKVAAAPILSDPELERWVLAAALRAPDTVLPLVTMRDFDQEDHRILLRAMNLLHEHGPFDLVTLSSRLIETGLYEKIGPASRPAELIRDIPETNPLLWIDALQEFTNKRSFTAAIENGDARMRLGENPVEAAAQMVQSLTVIANANGARTPQVYSVADLYQLTVPKQKMLVESLIPARGASLFVGGPKAGKTLFGVQVAVAVATNKPLLDYFRIERSGPALIIEQDDPSGKNAIHDILQKSGVLSGAPIYVVEKLPFKFGPEFLAWLGNRITALNLAVVVVDSYTALRSPRTKGSDIVKLEHEELSAIDDLGKQLDCGIGIIHHGSKGSVGMDWTNQGAGTYAMASSTEAQINVSRFREFDDDDPHRLGQGARPASVRLSGWCSASGRSRPRDIPCAAIISSK